MPPRTRKGLANWLTTSQTPIFVVDHREVILVFNKGCEELTGWSAADVIGKKCSGTSSAKPSDLDAMTYCLRPPGNIFSGDYAKVPVQLPGANGFEPAEISYFPLRESDEMSPRVMGVIGPWRDSGIEVVVPSAARKFDLQRILAQVYSEHQLPDLIANSSFMQQVARRTAIASQQDCPFHIQGETGVGKEYLARLVHHNSEYKERRFIPLDCKLLSHFELSRTLKRVQADQNDEKLTGTLFLKNVEHLPRDLQRMIQTLFETPHAIHIISSSTDEIAQLPEENLDSRLKDALLTLTVRMPTLLERRDDLLPLALFFAEKRCSEIGKKIEGLSPEVERELLKYHWPGNVLELRSTIEAAVDTCSSNLIEQDDLQIGFRAGQQAQQTRPARPTESLTEYLERLEREKITEALSSAQGNKTTAAQLLKVPRAKLYRRMLALGILDTDDQAETTA